MSSPGEVPRKPALTPGRFLALATLAFIAWQCAEGYADYKVREKVRRVLEDTADLRADVGSAVEGGKPMPLAKVPKPGPFVRRIELTPQGEIVSHLTAEVTGEETTVSWKLVTLAGGQRAWDCGGTIAVKYLPALCRGVD